MKLSSLVLWLSLGAWCLAASIGEPAELAGRVVVIANRDDPDSLRIARHYAGRRGVPEDNIIALRAPARETITWREFVSTIWEPLLEQLVRDRWIEAIPMTLTDAIGRRKHAPQGHRVAALVVCRGVPLRIAHEPGFYSDVVPLTRRAEFRTNAGAVDAELSLLAVPTYLINAFVPNPLFSNARPSSAELGQVIKVARLDGPSAEDAMRLVDRAIAAESTGLLGRAYVDLAQRDPLGDGWLEAAAAEIAGLGFDLTVDREGATFPVTARMDAPVLYFGWYAGDVTGPFTLPGFRFPPGAVALHIHSYSAHTLRSANSGWAGPMVARGVTATVGNVHEPYLNLTHQPHLLLRALARGATLAEAAYFALPALSWQAVLIGDPLYRPFGRTQPARPSDQPEVSSVLSGYAVLGRMRALDAAGRGAEAINLGRTALRDAPSLALAFEVARRLHADGNPDEAAQTLGFVSRLDSLPADQWSLASEAARLLERCGQPAKGVEIWKVLFSQPGTPAELRNAWLTEAASAAKAAHDVAQARAWERELESLTASANSR